MALVVKSPPANAETQIWPWVRKTPWHGNPLQNSCLENPMDREAWWATVHRVAKSWTWLKQLITGTQRYNYVCSILCRAVLFRLNRTFVGDFWRLQVKWHRTRHKTYKRQTHSGQRKNNNCTSKQAHGLFLYSSPGQNSRLYDQTYSVQRMCINVIVQQKGVKFRLTAESVQSPYHKKGMFPYLQGTINLKAMSIFLAEHLVCKQYISTFSLLWPH